MSLAHKLCLVSSIMIHVCDCNFSYQSLYINYYTVTMYNRLLIVHSLTNDCGNDGLADSAPSSISGFDCDTVQSASLQFLYSIAGVTDTTTSPASFFTISFISTSTAGDSLPHHLIASHH